EAYKYLYKKIKIYILNQFSPFKYYNLFSFVSKEINLNFIDSKYFQNLYQKNFIIKNILYKLQFEFYRDFNFALIFENDLIFFDKIPQYQSYFSIYHARFIKDENQKKDNENSNNSNYLSENLLRNFYFCYQNFIKNEDSIERAIDNGIKIINKPQILDEALKIFNLNLKSLNEDSLNRAYKRLVKKYHPDIFKNTDNNEGQFVKNKDKFIEIYEAYKLLKSLLF
ncbi:MAG: DnaJ domain-containing protein, partial [Exilispira sp.]